jgi:hypothetical protein
MQPQSCPSPRVVPTVTSRAAPGSVPGVDVHVRETVMYVLRLEADSHACLSDGRACVHTGHTTFASDPQSGQRSCLATLQCLPSMSVSHSSITCAPQTEWGGRQPRVNKLVKHKRARVESRRTSMRLLALAVGLLAPLAEAKTRHCADAVVNEALVSFDDYACVTDMKSCIGAGTCLAAGIKERRLCECYLQV